ncbi:MAG: succinate dehydrogenase cytochrome b subunit [Candidatus Omnitrophica bacterium]|nr:succinate dehydrogenase cytochrome b subunit [Candidatus Omnitrophota bacterium]
MTPLGFSIGKKAIAAVTGLALFGFVIAHLAGNLLIFFGPDALNAYAKKLRDLGPWLWAARVALLVAAISHVWVTILLAIENRRARTVRYAVYRPIRTTLGARIMVASGLLLLAFLISHLLHFTFGVTHPAIAHLQDPLGRHDVYRMVVYGFRDLKVALAYIIAMAFLCVHLGHGIASSFQSLGVTNERLLPPLAWAGRLAALAIFLGYVSIPLAVLIGKIQVPR